MEIVMIRQIKGIGDPAYFPDQGTVIAPMGFTDGSAMDIVIPVDEVGPLVAYFAGLNDFLSSQGVSPKRGKTDDFYGPIRVHGLGFQEEPEETLLVLDLAGCRLGFALGNTQLRSLAHKLSQVALALSADRKKAQ